MSKKYEEIVKIANHIKTPYGLYVAMGIAKSFGISEDIFNVLLEKNPVLNKSNTQKKETKETIH